MDDSANNYQDKTLYSFMKKLTGIVCSYKSGFVLF